MKDAQNPYVSNTEKYRKLSFIDAWIESFLL